MARHRLELAALAGVIANAREDLRETEVEVRRLAAIRALATPHRELARLLRQQADRLGETIVTMHDMARRFEPIHSPEPSVGPKKAKP